MTFVTSTGVVAAWDDTTEFEINNALPSAVNPFTSLNGRWGIAVNKAGNIELPGSHWLFRNVTPAIPHYAKILSASVAGGAQDNMSGTLTGVIEIVAKDGLWNNDVIAAHWSSGFHGTYPLNTQFRLFDSGPTLLAGATIATGVEPVLTMRQWGNTTPTSPSRLQKIGQLMRVATSGTLDTGQCLMRRVGTPGGNIWMEIWSVSGGLPSSLLATSDTRTANSISTASLPSTNEVFTFTGANQIVLTAGTDIVPVMAGDWAVNISNYIAIVHQQNLAPIANSYAVTYGETGRLGQGNYLIGQMPLDLAVVFGSGAITWAMPNFTINTVYTTPSIVQLIQSYVNDPSYVQGDPFLVRIRRLNSVQASSRGFKTWESPDTPGVVQNVTLTVTWRKPRRVLVKG